MANYEDFDPNCAFEAQARHSDADVLIGGQLPKDSQLVAYDRFVGQNPGLKDGLRLLAGVLFDRPERLRSEKHDRVLCGLVKVEADMEGMTDLELHHKGLDSIYKAIRKERQLRLEERADLLGGLVHGMDLWVSLDDGSDTPEAKAEKRNERDMKMRVARLMNFDIQRTNDNHPDPIALIEGRRGEQGLYRPQMGLYIGVPSLSLSDLQPRSV